MAWTWRALVLCWCLVRATTDDGPATVREVLDPATPSQPVQEEPSSGNLHFLTVRSENYSLQASNGLEWLASVTAQRGFKVDGVSTKCLIDMETYWSGLASGSPWAAKMYDASGRYSSELLFGNNFWMGSLSLCYEVKAPAFNVSFRVAKLLLTMPKEISPKYPVRPAFLGLCQPSSCSTNDTQRMLTVWTARGPSSITGRGANSTNQTSLTVLHVRQVPGSYSVLKDRRFQAISGTMIVVACIVFIGSMYEYLYHPVKEQERRHCKAKGENNNAFEADGRDDAKDQTSIPMKESTTVAEEKKAAGITEQNPKTRNQVGPAAGFLLAFSALSNGRQVLSLATQADGALKSIHGLRVFSLTWVILVHTYLQFFAIGGNKMIREVTERSFMFQTIGNATFSVDTFFFISGLLVAYLYNRKPRDSAEEQQESIGALILEFVKLVLYRFIRLTPVYLVVLGIVQQSMAYIRNNSVFEPNIMDHYNCENFWWRNILYVNNFYPRGEMCMLWSWYLAADTQFFTLSAIILLLAKRRFKLAVGVLCAILVSAWCTTAFVSYTNQYQARIGEPFGLFDELYDKPWTRIGPYIVGMGTGWLIRRTGKKLRIPLHLVLLGWVLSGGCLLSIVFGLGSGLSVPVSAVYVSLAHTAWGLSLAWIAVACHTGHGGVINNILANPMLYPLSRLTFCAYLVHPAIMVLTSYVMDGPFHIHNGLIVIIFLGNTVASFLLSFLLSLGFEAPIVRLLKIFLK